MTGRRAARAAPLWLAAACAEGRGAAPPRAAPAQAPPAARGAADTLPAAERRTIAGTIAFVSERDGRRAVYAVRPSGEGLRRVAGGPGASYPAAAAPDGAALAVVDVAPDSAEHAEQLRLVPFDGGAAVAIGPRTARARNPSWSPDGRWLAFEADVDAFREVYRVGRDGTGLRRLTHGRHGSFEPAVSPDGRRVAFVASRDGTAQLFVMRADGGGQRRLTAFHRDDWGPRWSPDGRTIAFLSQRVAGHDRVFLVAADGTGLRPLNPPAAAGAGTPAPAAADEEGIAWSPDGRRLAYVVRARGRGSEVWVADLVTGGRARVTGGRGAVDESPAWSPDGRYLVFASDREGDPELYLARADGTAPTRLTRAPGADWLPRWAADPRSPGGGRAGGAVERGASGATR